MSPARARLGLPAGGSATQPSPGPGREGTLLGLGQEGAHTAADGGPADGAQLQVGRTLGTHQVATGHEDDGHGAVQAHLAGPLLPQALQLLLCVPGPWTQRPTGSCWLL